MRSFNRFLALTAFAALLANAQDISGDWQGTLKGGAQEFRILLQVAKSDTGEWRATMLSIDQSPDRGASIPATSFSLDGSNIRFAMDAIRCSYDGKLSADGHPPAGRGHKAGRFPSNSGVPQKRQHGSTRRRIAHNSSL